MWQWIFNLRNKSPPPTTLLSPSYRCHSWNIWSFTFEAEWKPRERDKVDLSMQMCGRDSSHATGVEVIRMCVEWTNFWKGGKKYFVFICRGRGAGYQSWATPFSLFVRSAYANFISTCINKFVCACACMSVYVLCILSRSIPPYIIQVRARFPTAQRSVLHNSP